MAAPAYVAPRLERYSAPRDNPDQATAKTIRVMTDYIHHSALDPLVQQKAHDAVWRFGGGLAGGIPVGRRVLKFNASDPRICAFADFWLAKHGVRFVHHEVMLLKWLNAADELQLLISPDVLVRMARPQGDCAIFSMLIAALLKCQGTPYELVTVKCSAARPDEYSHVFCRAVLADGRRVALDGSHGKYPGWEVPLEHRYATQVWNENGQPIEDRGSTIPEGLHEYRRRGMGDDTSGTVDTIVDPATGNVYSSSTGQLLELGAYNTTPSNFSPSPTPVTPAAGTSPPSPSFASFAEGLATAWTKIAGNVIAPTTTVQRGPNGQVLISTPASSAANASILATSAGVGITSSPLLWIGAGLAGLFIISKMFSRH